MTRELDVKISYKCNNNCFFCLNQDKRNLSTSLGEIKKRISSVGAENISKLIISGGEPLISNKFFDLVEFASDKGVSNFEVQTNGRMLSYEKVVEKFKQYGTFSFLVSLHFPNKELYYKHCKVDGFDQVLKGIKNLQNHNYQFTVNVVVMKQNLNYLDDLLGILSNLSVPNLGFRFIDGSNFLQQYEDVVPTYTEAVLKIEKIVEKYNNIDIHLNEFPLCVLSEKLRDKAVSLKADRINHTFNDKVVETREVYDQQFLYPDCNNCKLKPKCLGVRNEYVDYYGKKEFNNHK